MHVLSLPGDKVGGVGPSVVVHRIRQVVRQVLQRPLPCDDGLHEEPEHGEHGQPSVLDLLHLELCERLRVVGEAEGVEAAAGVEGVGHLAERATGDTVALDGAHQDDLAGPDGEDALGVDQAGVAEVVQAALAKDLRAGLEPDGLAELDAVAGEELGEDAAEGAEHGPAAVDDLQLPVLGEGLGVGGEAGGVPAVVARELTGQVGGGLAGEGAEVLDAVGAVPGAAGGDGFGPGGTLAHGDAAFAEDVGGRGSELDGLSSEGGGGEGHCGSHGWIRERVVK
ncbi:unnamed protein product [Musa acuminata var. zebrina]